jgi:hypothetical protein
VVPESLAVELPVLPLVAGPFAAVLVSLEPPVSLGVLAVELLVPPVV